MGSVLYLYAAFHSNDSLASFLLGIGLTHDFKEIARPCLAPVNVLWNTWHLALLNTLFPFQINHSSLTGVTGPGTLAMVSSNTAILTVLSKYDLNGDGVLSAADVSIILNEVDGTTASCTAPSSGVGDGKCSLLDVELEILAVLGVIH